MRPDVAGGADGVAEHEHRGPLRPLNGRDQLLRGHCGTPRSCWLGAEAPLAVIPQGGAGSEVGPRQWIFRSTVAPPPAPPKKPTSPRSLPAPPRPRGVGPLGAPRRGRRGNDLGRP